MIFPSISLARAFLLRNRILLIIIAVLLFLLLLPSRSPRSQTSRYELSRSGENAANAYLLDTRTGRVWTSFAGPNQVASRFTEVTPKELR